MKLKFLTKAIKKIDRKTQELALLTLITKLKTSKEKFEKRKESILDRANLGFALMTWESALKTERKKPIMNQEAIKMLEYFNEWGVETLKSWKNKDWEKVDLELWNDVINYFVEQGAVLRNLEISES